MGISVLTGSSGFVGSHVAAKLLESGLEVRCLLRASSSLSALPEGCVPLTVDFMDPDSICEAVRDAEVVIHAAGAVKAGSQEEFDRANGLVTRNMLIARESVCPGARFVYVSSQAAAGPAGSDGPITAYGRSKLLGEIAVRDTENWVIVRPPAVFGPGDDASAPMFHWARRGLFSSPWTGGRFSMVYVEDLADLLVLLVDAVGVEGAVLDPSYGELFSWRDLHRAMEEASGRRILHLRIPGFLIHAAAFFVEAAAAVGGPAPFFTREKCRELLAESWELGECVPPGELADWSPSVPLVEALRRTLASV